MCSAGGCFSSGLPSDTCGVRPVVLPGVNWELLLALLALVRQLLHGVTVLG